MKNITLPKKASAFLTLALNDLIKAEASPDYRVDFESWHSPGFDGSPDPSSLPDTYYCSVCLAGAVIAGTLKASRLKALEPVDECFGDWSAPLLALDDVRRGGFETLIRTFEPELSDDKVNEVTTELESFYDDHEQTLLDGEKLEDCNGGPVFIKMLTASISSLESFGY